MQERVGRTKKGAVSRKGEKERERKKSTTNKTGVSRDGKGKRKERRKRNDVRRDSFCVCICEAKKENLRAKGDTAFSDEGGGSGKLSSLLILAAGGWEGQMSECSSNLF